MSAARESLGLPAGSKVGGYRLEKIHTAWGFYLTYLATNVTTGQAVAVLELLPEEFAIRTEGGAVSGGSDDARKNLAWARERFLREGRGLAACVHPAIQKVLEVLEENGTAYWVTPRDEPGTFKSWLKDLGRAPTEAELRHWLEPLLAALEQAHTAGLHHFNLKPESIQISARGESVLTHFAGARQAIARHCLEAGAATTGYSPSEQYDLEKTEGAWTDIYGLAAVMHRAIAGEAPPDAERRRGSDPYERLAKRYAGQYRESFLVAIDAALAVDPAARPQSIRDWRRMLGVASGGGVLGFARRRPGPVLAGTAVLALALWFVFRPGPVPDPAKDDRTAATEEPKEKESPAAEDEKKAQENKEQEEKLKAEAETKAAEEQKKREEEQKEKERQLAEQKAEQERMAAEKEAAAKAEAEKQATEKAEQLAQAAAQAAAQAEATKRAAEEAAQAAKKEKSQARKNAAEKTSAQAAAEAAASKAAAEEAARVAEEARRVAEKAAQEKKAAEQEAAKLAALREEAKRKAAESAAAQAQAEAEKRAAEQAAQEKMAAQKAGKGKPAADEAAEKAAAAEKAEADRRAAEQAAQEKMAPQKAIGGKRTIEEVAAEKEAAERAARLAAAQKAEAERRAAEQAAQQKMAAQKAAEEAARVAAAEKAAAEKMAADKAAQANADPNQGKYKQSDAKGASSPDDDSKRGTTSTGSTGAGIPGVWETTATDAQGKPKRRLTVYDNGRYQISDNENWKDSGVILAQAGRIQMLSDTTGVVVRSGFKLRSLSKIVTSGALGDEEWKRVSASPGKDPNAPKK